MVKAFIFGKFLPFHKGHEAMINFALTQCDLLSILVCCSDKESIDPETRKNWITETFESSQHIEVKVFNYSEDDLPNTSVSSSEVSRLWSQQFKAIFPDYHLVITSEEYGNYVASFMGIKHVPFDLPREKYSVSATAIRNDLFANWNFLPQSVKPYFAIKVVILGTESTGKTTLSEKLKNYYNCSEVKEAGRDLISNSNSFEFNDLYLVASEHAKRIDQSVRGNSPLVIIDTDIYTTLSYAKFLFHRDLQIEDQIYQANKADLYLYLNNDVEYFQDGTRLSETDRNLLDASNRSILQENNIAFIEINGNWQQRFDKAVEHIDRIIAANNRITHQNNQIVATTLPNISIPAATHHPDGQKYIFTSDRLGFRNWDLTDIDEMYEINADENVMAFFPAIPTKEQTTQFIERMRQQFEDKGFCYFAVDKLEDDQFIGFIGLSEQTYPADFTPCIDIGWRIKSSEWNKGFATEGAKKCLDYAFNTLKIKEIYAVAPKVNIKSERIMTKIGLKKQYEFEHPLLTNNEWLKTCVLYKTEQPQP